MWPHQVMIGGDGVAISVATDDAAVVDALAPVRIDVEADGSIDFSIEVSPWSSSASHVSSPPQLWHGSRLLARANSPDHLVAALLQTASSFAPLAASSEVRIPGLMPVLRGDRAALVPIELGGMLPRGWRERHGVEPVIATSVVVDVERLTVRIDGISRGDRAAGKLSEWWLPRVERSDETSMTMAQAVAHAVVLARPFVPDVTDDLLRGIGALVAGQPPRWVDPIPAPGATRRVAQARRAAMDRLADRLGTA